MSGDFIYGLLGGEGLKNHNWEKPKTGTGGSGLDPWACSSRQIKAVLAERVAAVPEADKWRLPYLNLLLEQRQTAQYKGFEEQEKTLSDLINSLCIN